MSAIVDRAAGGDADVDHSAFVASALANAVDAVVVAEQTRSSTDLRIVYVNAAFTRMTGYPAPDVVNRTRELLHGPATCAVSRSQMLRAIAQNESITVELLSYRRDGSTYLAEVALTPGVQDGAGSTQWISIERDITERPRAEHAHTREPVGGEDHGALLAEIRERERAEAQLAFKAVHDDLTGLYNRPYLMQRIEAAISRAVADPADGFSILHLDLDRFKAVNDRLGHRTGDRVLRDLSRRFEPIAGVRDTLARIGGDDFALLVESPDDVSEVIALAGRLIMEVANRPRFRLDDAVIAASIGIVHWTPGMNDAETIMRDAQIALESARGLPGSGYAVFSPEMHAQAEAAKLLRSDLNGAVERGELRLFYQPLVDIATGGVYGFEGLVRWQHPTRGLIAPDDFIPIAEETGMIVELGRWVLIEGCRKASVFQRLARRPLMMSLNVSSQQLLHPDFLTHLAEGLTAGGIDARTLQLEITESVFLAGGSVVGALFARIRALGIQIAFDDFGTGYSSLSYLERFQIDALKIDKSFVARLHDASAKSEILRMIIALAHALGVDIVAEGVESREQRDALGDLGCTHLQGFLYSRPIDEDAVAALFGMSDHGSDLDLLLGETFKDAGTAVLDDAQRSELREQVEAAIAMHYLWIDRLNAVVATGMSELDVNDVAREDVCPIGIWLNSTISESLRTMPLYCATKSRHAVFHRSAARLIAAALAGQPEAALSMRPDGEMTKVALSLRRTLDDWLAVATANCHRTPNQLGGPFPPIVD